jgi:hypothetical protein
MIKQYDERQLKELIKTGSVPERPSEDFRNRMFTMIKEKTEIQTHKPPRFTLFLSPRALAAAAAALILIIPLIILFTLYFSSSTQSSIPFLVVSNRGGTLVGRETSITQGYTLNEKDIIRTGIGEQVVLQRKNMAVFYLFSLSELEISHLTGKSGRMDLTLIEGSLFVNKISPHNSKESITVAVGDDYVFVLKGTCVYFSIDKNKNITIILYDGLISIQPPPDHVADLPLSLYSPEKLCIFTDGSWQKSTYVSWSEDEKALGELLRSPFPYTGLIEEIHLRKSGRNDSISPETILHEKRPEETPTPRPEKKPRYLISRIGHIGQEDISQNTVNFFSSAIDKGRIFWINQHELYRMENDRISKAEQITPASSFRARPLMINNTLCLSSANSLLLVDSSSLRLKREIAFPVDGSVDHNFSPQYIRGLVIIPIQNYGYYLFDSLRHDSLLKLIYKEPFPLAPLPAGNDIFIGSYYNSYIGLIDTKGAEIFKTTLGGNTFVNHVYHKDILYAYAEEADGNKIIAFDNSGKRIKELNLPWKIVSDFIVKDHTIWAVTASGMLVTLDTEKGNRKELIRIHATTLSSRQMRYLQLYDTATHIFAACEDGTIVVIDPHRLIVDEQITVNRDEKFFCPPLVLDYALYVVANTGTVYKIVKNEE